MTGTYRWFKFNAYEWADGEIVDCSYESQGKFINLCAMYFRQCGKVTLKKALRKLGDIDELIDLEVIKVDGEYIRIDFLDEQLRANIETSKKRSIAGRKGGLNPKASAKQVLSNSQANGKQVLSNSQASAKQKQAKAKQRRGEEKREEEIRVDKREALFGAKVRALTKFEKYHDEFLSYWTERGENDRKMRFEKEKSFDVKRRLTRWAKNDYGKSDRGNRGGLEIAKEIVTREGFEWD